MHACSLMLGAPSFPACLLCRRTRVPLQVYFALHQLIEAHKRDFEGLDAAIRCAASEAERDRCEPGWAGPGWQCATCA